MRNKWLVICFSLSIKIFACISGYRKSNFLVYFNRAISRKAHQIRSIWSFFLNKMSTRLSMCACFCRSAIWVRAKASRAGPVPVCANVCRMMVRCCWWWEWCRWRWWWWRRNVDAKPTTVTISTEIIRIFFSFIIILQRCHCHLPDYRWLWTNCQVTRHAATRLTNAHA